MTEKRDDGELCTQKCAPKGKRWLDCHRSQRDLRRLHVGRCWSFPCYSWRIGPGRSPYWHRSGWRRHYGCLKTSWGCCVQGQDCSFQFPKPGNHPWGTESTGSGRHLFWSRRFFLSAGYAGTGVFLYAWWSSWYEDGPGGKTDGCWRGEYIQGRRLGRPDL